ncbi:helicase-associated domain-containing protein, partial [Arthrobacter sp. H5]|uniref:helicase-associated domain-containing protein n=1 Tax=Arthrobacter sp. H5 TaxID=1267973 RepID=UPI00055ABA43
MSAIRALAQDLAARSDLQLRNLLEARPDLILPPVPDFAALAARASTRISVQRALENLTEPQLRVLEAVHLSCTTDSGLSTTAAWLRRVIQGATIKALDSLLAELHALALLRVAEPPEGAAAGDRGRRFYEPARTLHEALGPYPAGLGRSVPELARLYPEYAKLLPGALVQFGLDGVGVAQEATPMGAAHALHQVVSTAELWQRIMLAAPDRTAEMLSRLNASPVGSALASDRTPAAPALQWLLDRGLLVRIDASHVELPRPVGKAARGHVIVPELRLTPPAVISASVRVGIRDNAAHGSIAETLRLITELVNIVGGSPVTTLRTGGVGVRELRRLAEGLRVDTGQLSWLLELAAISGVIALNVDTSRWAASVPDNWSAATREDQWLRLVTAWLEAERAPSLVGTRVPSGTTVNTLAAEVNRPDAPQVRRRMLRAALAMTRETNDGAASPALEPVSLIERLTWHQPRLGRRFARLVPGMTVEAAQLGLLGSGALTELGALIAEEQYDDAAANLRDTLPEPLSHFMLQADLTAVAPGYLEPSVARELALLSTPEGQGPATMYRFSAASIRNALDEGQDAASILAFLSHHSATELPQPLRYLVEDTAARYGHVTVGQAFSFVKSDDDAALGALMTDNRAAGLGLAMLSPTVVVSQATPTELAAALRDLGYAPAL